MSLKIYLRYICSCSVCSACVDVKKGKRGACKHKAATVLPDRTAAA